MEECELKVVLLGQSAVGKTCIVGSLVSGRFDENFSPTLGASYASKVLDINGKQVSLQIWDTAGQERFRVLAPMYYRGAQAAILVYSIIDDSSFGEIDYWSNSLNENAGSSVKLFLVGNKSDLDSQRVITFEQGENKANSIGAHFFETSAKTGDGINDLFTVISKVCLEANEPGPSPNATVDVTKAPSGSQKKDCKC